jgi:hypothetical protein
MLKTRIKSCIWLCALLLLFIPGKAQQLKLGDPTATTVKAALLELNATNQGLLLPRIADTLLSPLPASPDGMIIYYIPARSLMIRRSGAWSRLADSAAVSGKQWLLDGNAGIDSATMFLGTSTAQPVNIRTNNINRIIVSSAGKVGIGTTTPSALLQVKTGTPNTSGVRLENLNSASPVTAGAGGLGVDASGNVVRAAAAPVLYNRSGVVSQPVKIWTDSVDNISTGLPVADISSAGFTKIISIQATGKGGTSNLTVPVVAVTGYSTTQVSLMVLKGNSAVLGLLFQSLIIDGDASQKIFVTVTGY